MKRIREGKRVTEYWNHSLPSLRQAQQADRTHNMEDSLSSLHLTERTDSKNKGQRRQVTAQHTRCVSSVNTRCPHTIVMWPLQVKQNNEEDDGSSGLEVL